MRELERRVLVIDGAMGTLLQAHGLSEEDYRALEVAASTLGSSLAKLLLELRKAAPAS